MPKKVLAKLQKRSPNRESQARPWFWASPWLALSPPWPASPPAWSSPPWSAPPNADAAMSTPPNSNEPR